MKFLRRLYDKERQAEADAKAAAHHLAEVKARTPKVRALAKALIEIQETNHLGASAAKVLRGGQS